MLQANVGQYEDLCSSIAIDFWGKAAIVIESGKDYAASGVSSSTLAEIDQKSTYVADRTASLVSKLSEIVDILGEGRQNADEVTCREVPSPEVHCPRSEALTQALETMRPTLSEITDLNKRS